MSESGHSPDPIAWLKGLAESATKIRLAPGVLGKTHTVMLGIIVLWGIVILRLSAAEVWLDVGLIACACIGTVIGSVWCSQSRTFAQKNPALALMEGADITEYKRFEAQTKGHLASESPLTFDPERHPPSVARIPPEIDEDG